jgi:hypothetical protein
MDKFVSVVPNAIAEIETRIEKRFPVTRPPIRKPRNAGPRDAEFAELVRITAVQAYAGVELPVRITMNRLRTLSALPQSAFLDDVVAPLARAAARDFSETDWHYYARRYVWAVLTLEDRLPITTKQVIEQAGLEWNRGAALVTFFGDRIPTDPIRENSIMSILRSFNISRTWSGPEPGKQYPLSGRAHQLAKRGS